MLSSLVVLRNLLDGIDEQDIRDSFLVWDVEETLHGFRGFSWPQPQEISKLILQMVACNALESSLDCVAFTPEPHQVAVLIALEEGGWVRRALQPGTWLLVEDVQHSVEAIALAHQDRKVACVRPNRAPKDMTRFEVLLSLEEDGWHWTRATRRRSIWYEVGGEKVYYSSGLQPCLGYLLCLLQAAELKDRGIKKIPHVCHDHTIYDKLLKGIWPDVLDDENLGFARRHRRARLEDEYPRSADEPHRPPRKRHRRAVPDSPLAEIGSGLLALLVGSPLQSQKRNPPSLL